MTKSELETLASLLQKFSNEVYQIAKQLNDNGNEDAAREQMVACQKVNEVSEMVEASAE